MGTNAVAEAPANAAMVSPVGNHANLVAAINQIGGIDVLVRRSTLTKEYVEQLIAGDVAVEPSLCPEIERATPAQCEELRSDLIWHRDGAGEVIGYSSPVDSNSRSSLDVALRGVAAEGARATRPFEGDFGVIPVIGKKVYAINPEVPSRWLLSEASCMVDALREVASDGVDTPMSSAAAWLLERNLQCVQALIEAVEVRSEFGA